MEDPHHRHNYRLAPSAESPFASDSSPATHPRASGGADISARTPRRDARPRPGRYNATVSRGTGRQHNGRTAETRSHRYVEPPGNRWRTKERACHWRASFWGLVAASGRPYLSRLVRPATALHAGRAFVASGPWRQPWHIGCSTRSKVSFAFGGRSVCVPSACKTCRASRFLMCTGAGRAGHSALSALSYTRIRHAALRAVTHCPPSNPWRAECHRADSFNHSP
jgi:hypothetical protein